MTSSRSQRYKNKSLNNSLWNDSVELYQKENIKTSCLYLQNHCGVSVTVFLSCLWYSQNRRGVLSQVDFKNLMQLLAPWQKKLTDQIRTLRIKVYNHPDLNSLSPKIKSLRDDILGLEIFSEQIQFAITYDFFLSQDTKYRKQQKSRYAIANLHNYFALEKIALDENGYEKVSAVLSEVFPDFIENHFPQVSIPFVFRED